MTYAFCCSPADGGGRGGDTFDDDGGGDAGDTAGWNDTAGSPQQSFQTQGTSAMQASEASQVSSAIQLACSFCKMNWKDAQRRGTLSGLKLICLFVAPVDLTPPFCCD